MLAGEKSGKSLLDANEPSLWYEAAAGLPQLDPASSHALSHEEIEERRTAAEEAITAEAASFEKAFGPLQHHALLLTASVRLVLPPFVSMQLHHAAGTEGIDAWAVCWTSPSPCIWHMSCIP